MRAAGDYVTVVTYSNSTLVRSWEDNFLADAFIKAYIDFKHIY